jgi:hypothetical protein
MKTSPRNDEIILEFANFLNRNNLTIPDKDVANVIKLKYGIAMNVAEYSGALCLLESQNLLDKKKSINKDPHFYTEKHKIFMQYATKQI